MQLLLSPSVSFLASFLFHTYSKPFLPCLLHLLLAALFACLLPSFYSLLQPFSSALFSSKSSSNIFIRISVPKHTKLILIVNIKCRISAPNNMCSVVLGIILRIDWKRKFVVTNSIDNLQIEKIKPWLLEGGGRSSKHINKIKSQLF